MTVQQRGASWASPAHPGASGSQAAEGSAMQCLSIALPHLQARQRDSSAGDSGPLGIPQEAPGPSPSMSTAALVPVGGRGRSGNDPQEDHTAKIWQNYCLNLDLLALNPMVSAGPCVMRGVTMWDVNPVRVCGERVRR